MKVLVYGAIQSHPNFGVAALAVGSEAVLRRAFPEADVRFRSTGAEGDGPMNLTHTTPLLREILHGRLGLEEWTRSFDLVCDIRGGDSLTDIYSVKALVKQSVFPFYAQRSGVPVVLLPQTIGPFEKPFSRLLARRFLKACQLVMTRDPRSTSYALELGQAVAVTATDVVFAIDPPPATDVEHDVILNASGLLWEENRHVDHSVYREAVRLIVDQLLADGRQVTVLAHVVGPTDTGRDNDRTALAALRAEYGSRLRYLVPRNLAEVRRTMSGSRLVVGARMHACLNALSVGVPAVPMAYSRKFAPLLDELSWRHTVDLAGSAQDIAVQVHRESALAEIADVDTVNRIARQRIDEVVHALRSASLPRP